MGYCGVGRSEAVHLALLHHVKDFMDESRSDAQAGVGIGVNKLLVDSAPDLTRRQRRRAATGTAALLGIVVVGGPPGWALGLLALGVLLGFLRAKPVVESGLITFGGAALGVGIAVAIVGYAVAGLVGAMFACPFAVGHWIARSNLANRNK